MVKQFLRRTVNRYTKLGKGRKKKQVWRRPKGRDNKMREKRKGYPAVVSVGYRKDRKERKNIAIIRNVNDLEKVGKSDVLVLGKVGKKKKAEILGKAKELKFVFQNINSEKILKQIESEIKKKELAKKGEKSKKEEGKEKSTGKTDDKKPEAKK